MCKERFSRSCSWIFTKSVFSPYTQKHRCENGENCMSGKMWNRTCPSSRLLLVFSPSSAPYSEIYCAWTMKPHLVMMATQPPYIWAFPRQTQAWSTRQPDGDGDEMAERNVQLETTGGCLFFLELLAGRNRTRWQALLARAWRTVALLTLAWGSIESGAPNKEARSILPPHTLLPVVHRN